MSMGHITSPVFGDVSDPRTLPANPDGSYTLDDRIYRDWRCPEPGCGQSHFGVEPPKCSDHPPLVMVPDGPYE